MLRRVLVRSGGATLLALRLTAIGEVAWLALRFRRRAIAREANGAHLARMIRSEQVSRVARAAVVVLGAQRLRLNELPVGAHALVWLTGRARFFRAARRVVAVPTVRTLGRTRNTVFALGTTLVAKVLTTGREVPCPTYGLRAEAGAHEARRAHSACCPGSLRAARREGTNLARRALVRLVIRVLAVITALVALRLAAIGKVAWLATRLLRATVASKTDGADLASVICREEVRRVARTAVVVRNTLRLLDELAVGAFPGKCPASLVLQEVPSITRPAMPVLDASRLLDERAVGALPGPLFARLVLQEVSRMA